MPSTADCSRIVRCPSGYQNLGVCFRAPGAPPFDPDKNKGTCSGCTGGGVLTGLPINIGAANKTLVETDIPANPAGLQFQRTYNSLNANPAMVLGVGWQHIYNLTLTVDAVSGSSTFAGQAAAFRADGRIIKFAQAVGSSSWVSDPDVTDQLQTVTDGSGNITGYQLTDGKSDRVESYDTNGKLTAINDPRTSQTLRFAYDSNLRLQFVTDRAGRQLQIGYDSYGRISDVWQPEAILGSPTSPHWQYGYDANNNLATITTPSGTTRTYAYENTSFVNALTGIVDEKSNRYVTYIYDSQGNASGENLWSGPSQTLPVGQYTIVDQGNNLKQVTDPLGLSSNFQFKIVQGVAVLDNVSQPCAFCGGPGMIKSRGYDATTGFTNQTTDFNGNVTTYNYNTRGLLAQRVEASSTTSQRTSNTTWNANFHIPDQRTVLNASSTTESLTKWTYNPRGQVLSRCEADPAVSGASSYTCGSSANAPTGVRQTTYTYCEQAGVTAGTCPLVGLMLTVDGPRTDVSDVTTYTYYQTTDLSGCPTLGGACHSLGDLYKVTNALNQVTTYISYDKNGRITRTKDGSGVYMDYSYSPRGWLVQRILRADPSGNPNAGDELYSFTYDNVGNLTKSAGPVGEYLSYTYDAAHRLTDVTDKLGNTVHYTLDAAGNRTKEDTKDPSSTLKRTLSRQYDQLNRLTKTLNATSVAVQTYQNPAEAPPTGVTYTNGYDGNGNAIYSVDSNGVGTEQQYDPLNRLVKTLQDHAGTGATHDAATQYTYDARDNLRTVTDPDGLITTYTYDGLNNLTQLQSPDTGATTYGYDAAGNRTSQIDARSVTTSYQYDALNRLTKITYPTSSSLNVTYEYDQSHPNATCPTPASVGQLTGMTDSTGTTTYCYGWHGNLRTKIQTINGVSYTTTYNFDNSHNIIGIVYPSGAILSYGQDSMARITSATYQANASAATATLLSSISYYPFGPANVFTYGNGHTLTKSYDQNYAISQVVSSLSSALTIVPTVDPMGNITNASNTVGAGSPTVTFQYDPLYRLTSMSPIVSYTYNKTGDRLTKTLQGGTPTTYTYATGTHRLASDGTNARSYDANGNTQTIGTTALTYDDRNRLATGAGTPYFYNGKGERVAKGSPQQQFVYDESGALLGEYGSAGTPVNEYLRIGSQVVGVTYGGTLYYVETDHVGTPRAVIQPGSTPANDALMWKWDFFASAFGGTQPSPAAGLNLRYPGQYFDAETGLFHNGWRDYEPGTGRYPQSDPAGLRGGVNTYAYVLNNPLRFTDPFGLWVKICSRQLSDKNSPPTGRWHPFRHDYINVSGAFLGFTPVNDGTFWGPGKISSDEQDNGRCSPYCDDDKFDSYVLKAAQEIGAPTYCPLGEPGLPGGDAAMGAGAINCHTWVTLVLQKAKEDYLAHEKCPTCFK